MHAFLQWRTKTVYQIIILFCCALNGVPTFSHGEEIKINSGAQKGPVTLSIAQEKMLEIKTSPVSMRPLAELLKLNGQIELLPNAQADVSVRISGSVVAIDANLGDEVKAKQRLAVIQSRLIGNPPPSVGVNAPMAGLIDARNVNLGQAVEPNTVLFHISNRDKLLAVAKVYEEDVGKIKLGQEANVHVLSYSKKVFTGSITLVEPNLDVLTRTVNVQVSLNNQNDLLKPGMFARINVILSKNQSVLAISNASLIEMGGEAFVFVRTNHNYERVEVNLGASDDNYSEIIKGLVPGDEVVTQGNRELYTLWLSGSQSKPKKEDHH
ncbi:MAG: efflux RND transporter periplasmic adaptor subunit [Legionella sp.]|nr:efflux RND transporter periplasmic adaptor subunit [Legionella sp.]